ncbi:MAG: acyl carrier protein [Candidatus Methylomirabilales bacterium]
MSQAHGGTLSRAEVEAGLATILEESLGVAREEIRPSASLVRDLGAESIDFLDMGFKIQQAFGVNLQTAEIRDRIMGWGALVVPSLAELLSARLGAAVGVDDLKGLEGRGLDGILSHLQATRGLRTDPGAAEEIAEELLRRLLKEFQALGFGLADGDRHGLLAQMRADLSGRRLTERTLDLLTVEALVNFICAKLGSRLAEQ